MTKKHFEAIADRIRVELRFAESEGKDRSSMVSLVKQLAIEFKDINRAFDRDSFFKACGIEV